MAEELQDTTNYIEALTDWFSFVPDSPLIFSDGKFWYFFALVLLVVQFVRNKILIRNMFLLAFSLFFYYKSSGVYFILLVVSTFIDYFLGNLIYKESKEGKRKFYVVLSLFSNLSLLAYYKYSTFFIETINHLFHTAFVSRDYVAELSNAVFGTSLQFETIFLPVGISFYTFQTISYSLDIYRKEITPVKNIFDFGFFVSFFPQLVAGPIVRAQDFIPQIYEKFSLTKKEYNKAIYLIVAGLIKKVLIADYLAGTLVDGAFEEPLRRTSYEVILGVYGYALQIYGDFSGYSDMAIGLSMLIGFTLPVNFNAPYISQNITEFWRRWHISLSSWLRDYLYIPLGGNRSASFFTQVSLPIGYTILFLIEGYYWPVVMLFVGSGVLYVLSKLFKDLHILFYFGAVLHILATAWLIYFALVHSHHYLSASFSGVVLVLWLLIVINRENSLKVSTYLNLFLTMLLGGLWHGASVKFVIWGIMHGTALAIHKLWMELTHKIILPKVVKIALSILSIFITFHFVLFCWIYFRAPDMQNVSDVLTSVSNATWDWMLIEEVFKSYEMYVYVLIFGFVIHFIPKAFKEKCHGILDYIPDPVKAILLVLIIIVVYQVKTAGHQGFIYFQF